MYKRFHMSLLRETLIIGFYSRVTRTVKNLIVAMCVAIIYTEADFHTTYQLQSFLHGLTQQYATEQSHFVGDIC